MTSVSTITEVAALIGEPARATMLVALMDGRALTAGELATVAGVSPSTASEHLGRMLETGLLALERQGRHRYYRVSNASVAGLVENLMSVSGELAAATRASRPVSVGPSDRALRRARLCYDHLAGEIAVGIATSMTKRGQLELNQDGGSVSEEGLDFLVSVGVDLRSDTRRSRPNALCRPCLDWSERRAHIAGSLGRQLLGAFIQRGWVRPQRASRIVDITPLGLQEFGRRFDLNLH